MPITPIIMIAVGGLMCLPLLLDMLKEVAKVLAELNGQEIKYLCAFIGGFVMVVGVVWICLLRQAVG